MKFIEISSEWLYGIFLWKLENVNYLFIKEEGEQNRFFVDMFQCFINFIDTEM